MLPRKSMHYYFLRALPLALGFVEGSTVIQAEKLEVRSGRFGSVGVQYPVQINSQNPRNFSLQGGGGQSVSTIEKPSSAQFGMEGGFAHTKTYFAYQCRLKLGDFLNRPPFTIDKVPINIRIHSGLDGSIGDELDGFVGTSGEFIVLTDVNPAPLIDGLLYPTEISVKASHWLRRRLVPVQPDTPEGYPQGIFSLINGDANGDNVVNTADNVFVAQHMQSKLGEPKYDPNADLNGDAKVAPDDLKIVHGQRVTQGDE